MRVRRREREGHLEADAEAGVELLVERQRVQLVEREVVGERVRPEVALERAQEERVLGGVPLPDRRGPGRHGVDRIGGGEVPERDRIDVVVDRDRARHEAPHLREQHAREALEVDRGGLARLDHLDEEPRLVDRRHTPSVPQRPEVAGGFVVRAAKGAP